MNTSSEEHTTTSSSNVLFPLSSHGRTYRLPQCADELPMAKLAVPGGGGAPEDVRRRGGAVWRGRPPATVHPAPTRGRRPPWAWHWAILPHLSQPTWASDGRVGGTEIAPHTLGAQHLLTLFLRITTGSGCFSLNSPHKPLCLTTFWSWYMDQMGWSLSYYNSCYVAIEVHSWKK